jgi:alpha-N-arabinofuranosidase
MMIPPRGLITLLSLFVLPAFAQDSSSTPAVISVDASTSPGPVNRLVFGQNVEAADNARIFSSNTTDPDLIGSALGFWDPDAKAPAPEILDLARQVGTALLRYPGGSMVHNYDWRKAVGPLESRGAWKFGIDEYITLCKALGAVPMFTVSDYVLPVDQMPAHDADLVEYLNAPATPDHPWAMKRAAWGHPDPYGIKYFELGCESAEGNMRVIPRRVFTPEEYGNYANATAVAMKAVDPSIKLGLVMMPGPGTDVDCTWNKTAIQEARKSVDFLIIHLYGPDIGKNVPESQFLQAYMAVAEQSEKHLDEYRALAQQELGHELPLAVTEYNGSLTPERAPYRLSYAYALESADYLRIFLQPEHQVLGASYWEFLNGAFGMVRTGKYITGNPGTSEAPGINVEPAFFLYHLWAQHLGTKLATVQVDGPRASFAGAGSVFPASGDTYTPAASLGVIPTDNAIATGSPRAGVSVESGTTGAFTVRIDNITGKVYPRLALFPRPSGAGACDYVVSYDARYIPDPGTTAVPLALGVEDSRGWPVTHSAIAIDGIGADWKTFQARYHGLPDTAEVEMQGRLEAGSATLSGQLEVRNLKIEAFSAAHFPAYPLLTSSATLSEDGKTLHVIVFNKSTDQPISASFQLKGFQASSAKIWEVNGPSLNASTGVADTVEGAPLDLSGASPTHVFPAHSMTAIDFIAQSGPSNP